MIYMLESPIFHPLTKQTGFVAGLLGLFLGLVLKICLHAHSHIVTFDSNNCNRNISMS